MRNIYLFTCIIYNKFFSIIENYFFFETKKKISSSSILKNGFELLNFNQSYFKENPEKQIKMNNYMTKFILKKKDIYENLVLFFNNNNLKNIITSKTGYEYSVDYIICYTTFQIPTSEINKNIYANKWHNDKPFSRNTLKIIIPLNEVDNYNGGIEILDINQTKKFKKGLLDNEEKHFILRNKLNEILLFLPNLCFHRAGNPTHKDGRKQIMIQLNPARKWSLNKKIYQKQFKIEPKFPYFNYFFDGKKIL